MADSRVRDGRSRILHLAGVLWIALLILGCARPALTGAIAQPSDEAFVGPFASWTDVRAAYGAKGDGVSDDTAAIQAALGDLGPKTATLYFPAGTYRITRTLTLAHRIYVNIVGEDPSTTRIVWDGDSSAGGAMLRLNGMAYSRIDRLTFDGRGKAGVAVDESWTGSGGYFDTGNQYADDRFENAGIGFRCGNLDNGCAETVMLRDQFIGQTVAGVAMKNFNALDMFIWDSVFRRNAVGVTNSPGAGNFHVYGSVFEGSTTADIVIGNTGVFNFRNDYSIGSNRFIQAGGTSNPALITVQGDTILDTRDRTAISIGDLGPVILLDNTIRSSPGAKGPAVVAASFNPTDLFSMGNTFTVPSPIFASGHHHSFDDRTVDPATVKPPAPALPGVPPKGTARVFEAKPGSTDAQIQQLIDQAGATGGARAIVHLPAGAYRIASTLVVPAGRDIQIVGDGHESKLVWSGRTAGPILRLLGPSKASLREFSVNGNGHSADGIEVDDADQAGGRVFMESPFLSSSWTNLLVDRLDRTRVELRDFEHSGAQNPAGDAVSVKVVGGPHAARGSWQGGATNIFAGASSGNNLSYDVAAGAHLGVRDIWYDAGGGAGQRIARFTGSGVITYAGSAIYQSGAASGPAIVFNDFHGVAALLNLGMSGAVEVSGDGSGAKVAAIGLVSGKPSGFVNRSMPPTASVFLNGQTTVSPPRFSGSSEIAEQGTLDEALLSAALKQVRTERPQAPARSSVGITEVRIYRVFVESTINGICLEAGQPAARLAGPTRP